MQHHSHFTWAATFRRQVSGCSFPVEGRAPWETCLQSVWQLLACCFSLAQLGVNQVRLISTCLLHVTRADWKFCSGSGGVVWKKAGGSVTIQCRHPTKKQNLSLMKGMSQDVDREPVLYKSRLLTIAPQFSDRVQLSGDVPDVDIVISNLTAADTGAYWCMYERFDATTNEVIKSTGKGSVLLVVKGETSITLSIILSIYVTYCMCRNRFCWIKLYCQRSTEGYCEVHSELGPHKQFISPHIVTSTVLWFIWSTLIH